MSAERASRRYWEQTLTTTFPGLDPPDGSATDFVKELQRLLSTGKQSDASLAWSRIAAAATQLQRARTTLREVYGLNVAPPPPPPRSAKRSKVPVLHASADIAPPPLARPHPQTRQSFCGGNCEAILTAMARYPEHEALQLRGCSAVLDLLESEPKSDGFSWVCGSCSFRNHVDEEDRNDPRRMVPCRICAAPASSGKLEAITVAEAERVLLVGSQREQHEGSETGRRRAVHERLIEGGGVRALLAPMRTFPASPKVQRAACFALARLAHRNQNAVARLVAEGGVRDVLSAMMSAPADAELQAQALGVLASPVLLEDAVVRVEGPAFMAAVLAAMRRYVAHTRLQALACLALANLAFKKDEYVVSLTAAGLVEGVVVAVERNAGDSRTVAAGLWTLVGLTRELSAGADVTEEQRERVRNGGGVQLCAEALARFHDHTGVRTNAEALLGNLGATSLMSGKGGGGVYQSEEEDDGNCVLQ